MAKASTPGLMATYMRENLRTVKGTAKAFHPRIHATRPHTGQRLVASRLRAMLQPGNPSEIYKNHRYTGKVQDAYTLRCAPQIHGIAHDTVEFVRGLLNVELNSATDNPMVFNGPIGEEWVELGKNTTGADTVVDGAGKGDVASSSAVANAGTSSSSSSSSPSAAPVAHNNRAPPKHTPIDNMYPLAPISLL